MPTYNYQLRGWHAVLAVLALLGFTGLKMAQRIRPVDNAMRAAVRDELLNEYSGRGPKDVASLVAQARAGQPLNSLPPVVQRDVEFTSIGARSAKGSSVVLIKAEITVDGGAPPDGRSIRYFCIEQKFAEDSYIVVGNSSAYNYFREIFP